MNESTKRQLENLNQRIKETNAAYHYSAVKFGMSDSEFWVLYTLLVFEGEYSQQNICEIWSLPKQTINSGITSLTKKGYVFLEAVPGTRNRKTIHLTEEGKRFGENTVMRVYEAEQKALSQISEQELQACIKLLGKYTAFFSEEVYKK